MNEKAKLVLRPMLFRDVNEAAEFDISDRGHGDPAIYRFRCPV